MDPAAHFSEVCETLVVNAHGCAMRSRVKLETGVRLRLHSREGRDTTAQVVSCQPFGSDSQSWMLGARLDRPDNFWGLRNCPKDWAVAAGIPVLTARPQNPTATNSPAAPQAAKPVSQPSEVAHNQAARQTSEEQVKHVITESMRSIQAEVAALREKLLHKEANPSRFEVSLSSIPPELEQQIELRLRKGLEPKVLDEARQQSAQLLVQAQAAIDRKTTEAHERFSGRLAEERRAFEQRAQEISKHISETVRDRVGVGVNEFQQKLVEGGNQLKRLSEELLEFLQSSVNDEHNARRGELEELRAAVKAESARLHELTERLDSRIAKLSDSVRSLESGLDQRLNQMCGRAVSDTRSQLESMAGAILTELTTRSAEALGKQLDETGTKMRDIQKGTVAAVSESLDVQTRNTLQGFERSAEDMARASVERWRQKLASGLSALAKSLDEQLKS
jgi:uncharacterized phage infection (PIP) family protein YhgE